jgi:hypothetical protein
VRLSVKNEEPKRLDGGREGKERKRTRMGMILKGSRLPTQQTNSWRRSPLTLAAQAHTHTSSESSAFHNPKVKVRRGREARRRQVCTGQPAHLDAEEGPCWALLEPSFSRLSFDSSPLSDMDPLIACVSPVVLRVPAAQKTLHLHYCVDSQR